MINGIVSYLESNLFNLLDSLIEVIPLHVIPAFHQLFLISELFVFVGLHIQTIHGVFKLGNSLLVLILNLLKFKFMLQMLSLIVVSSVVVLTTKIFVFLYLL